MYQTEVAALFAANEFASSYKVQGHRPFEHPIRVGVLVSDFLGMPLNVDHVKQAAILHDLPDALYNQTVGGPRPIACRALTSFVTAVGYDQALRVASILADKRLVDEEARAARLSADLGVKDEEYIEVVHGDSRPVTLPTSYWLQPRAGIVTEPIERLFQRDGDDINFETGIIGACEVLDHLHKPKPVDQQDPDTVDQSYLMRKIHEAELFHAVLAEATGYDGLAMAIRDTTSSKRFDNSGDEGKGILQVVRKRLEVIQHQDEIEQVFGVLFGKDKFYVTKVIGDDSNMHNVWIADIVATLGDLDPAGPTRRKSDGSAAYKVLTKNGFMDDIGITLIGKDDDEVIALVDEFIKRVDSVGEVQFTGTNKRQEPFVVKGGSEYAKTFEANKRLMSMTFVDDEPTKSDFKAIKVNVLVEINVSGTPHQIPVEVQFQTKADRKAARVSETGSHALTKTDSGILVVNPGAFTSLNERKQFALLHPGALTKTSLIRGERLLRLAGISGPS